MKKYVLLLAVATSLAACQSDQKQLNDRMERIEKKLDALIASGGGRGAAAQPQRPQRPQPDASKTYAVSIENDPIEGPVDAKVTLIEAFDYA